ncbi:MAG: dicarboxylate/amino acid:cation symporter [Planctomycetota bacterium]
MASTETDGHSPERGPSAAKRKATLAPWTWPLHWQILLGLVIGGVAGAISASTAISSAEAAGDAKGAEALVLGRWDWMAFDLIGDLFIQGLKLIIVPIVVSSIVLSISRISGQDFGRLGVKTLSYYIATSTLAILVGLSLVNLVNPGTADSGEGILVGQDLTAFDDDVAEVSGRAEGKEFTSFLDVFRKMVPDNLFAAASDNGQLLGLIVVAILIGFFLSRVPGEPGRVMTAFTEGVYQITLKIVDFVLMLAPIGVAALIAGTIAQYGARLIPSDDFDQFAWGIGKFAITALAALVIHFAVTMPLILLFVARVNPLRHYKAMAPALLTAFSTASSSATLPVTMDCIEERAGVSNKTASFTLPLGATVNMDGTALYECVAAIFICQAFGLDLSFGQQFFVVIAALLTSIGVAGVPSASIVAIVLILTTIGNSVGVSLVAGLGLLWVFDRPLDMCRTAVNIFSDSVGAVTIAKSEGENVLTGAPAADASGSVNAS